MKTVKNIQFLFALMAFLSVNFTSAQNAELIETLNIEQIKLLDKSKQIIKENRREFKALLNEEQKNLLKNKSISKRERMTILKPMLSQEQLNIYTANRAEDKESRKAFRNSLSPDQHAILKTARHNRIHKPANRAEKKILMEKITERKKALGIID